MYNFMKRRRLDGDEPASDNQLLNSPSSAGLLTNNLVDDIEMMAVSVPDSKEQPSSISLPFFGIQCDWDEALSTPKGTSWVTVRHPGHPSIHGNLQYKGSEIIGSEPFAVSKNRTTKHVLTINDEKTGDECSFIAPTSIFNKIHNKNKSVVSMDVTEGGLGVSVCSNNELKVWETETGNVRRVLAGHLADVYTCRFFPSGIVILSAGADMSLKIWSAETGDCPVTMRGHTASINDTCIVERGRNIISVSKDGTAKLWDCGESKCLTTLADCAVPIISCALIPPSSVDLGQPIASMSDREVGTQGKLLLLAREDKKIQGISIGSRKEIFNLQLPSSINKIVANGSNSFLVGTESGQIELFDLRKVVPLSKSISFATETPILDLMCHPRSPSSRPGVDESNRFFWATKSDGTVTIVNPNFHDSSRKYVQLTGSDSDPIYQIKHDGNYIFTACRDGLIRKYSIDQVMKVY